MTNDMHQLHHASDDDFVSRIHTSLLAMRSSVCDSSQAVKSDAGATPELSDAQGQSDAPGDLAGCENNVKSDSSPINTCASSYKYMSMT